MPYVHLAFSLSLSPFSEIGLKKSPKFVQFIETNTALDLSDFEIFIFVAAEDEKIASFPG